MNRAQIGGLELQYEVQGRGEAVVLIHGSFIADGLRPLLAEPSLTERFQVFLYHRRGFASSPAGSEERSTAAYRELIGLVGFAVLVFPILSFASTLVVTAIKVSLVQGWATEGTVFGASYYRNVFRMYLPWFLVGAGMIGVLRLMGGQW